MHSHPVTVHVAKLNGSLRSYKSNHGVLWIRTTEIETSKNESTFRFSENRTDPISLRMDLPESSNQVTILAKLQKIPENNVGCDSLLPLGLCGLRSGEATLGICNIWFFYLFELLRETSRFGSAYAERHITVGAHQLREID